MNRMRSLWLWGIMVLALVVRMLLLVPAIREAPVLHGDSIAYGIVADELYLTGTFDDVYSPQGPQPEINVTPAYPGLLAASLPRACALG